MKMTSDRAWCFEFTDFSRAKGAVVMAAETNERCDFSLFFTVFHRFSLFFTVFYCVFSLFFIATATSSGSARCRSGWAASSDL